MANKPIIGIVGRIYVIDNRAVIEVNDDYRIAVIRAGGLPFIIVPPNDYDYVKYEEGEGLLSDYDKDEYLRILKLCDGFIMTGGSTWYQYDEILCQYAVDNDIPLLGICLGMQIIAYMDEFIKDGNSDKTELNNTYINHYRYDLAYVHKNIVLPSKLIEIIGKRELMVNSRHSYHIIDKPFFKVSSYSEDGIIESIELPDKKFVIGVQWHPESMIDYDSDMLKIFESFINTCQNSKI